MMALSATGGAFRVLKAPALRLARAELERAKPTSEVPTLMRECIGRLSHEPAENDWTYIFWEERFWMTHDLDLEALKVALTELDADHFKRLAAYGE